jgi:hypothetical protein
MSGRGFSTLPTQTTKDDRLRHQTRGTILSSYFLDTAPVTADVGQDVILRAGWQPPPSLVDHPPTT